MMILVVFFQGRFHDAAIPGYRMFIGARQAVQWYEFKTVFHLLIVENTESVLKHLFFLFVPVGFRFQPFFK